MSKSDEIRTVIALYRIRDDDPNSSAGYKKFLKDNPNALLAHMEVPEAIENMDEEDLEAMGGWEPDLDGLPLKQIAEKLNSDLELMDVKDGLTNRVDIVTKHTDKHSEEFVDLLLDQHNKPYSDKRYDLIRYAASRKPLKRIYKIEEVLMQDKGIQGFGRDRSVEYAVYYVEQVAKERWPEAEFLIEQRLPPDKHPFEYIGAMARYLSASGAGPNSKIESVMIPDSDEQLKKTDNNGWWDITLNYWRHVLDKGKWPRFEKALHDGRLYGMKNFRVGTMMDEYRKAVGDERLEA